MCPLLVRKKLAISCLLFAWICANGALLDALQVIAWGKMFAGYAQTMPVAAALNETLDPAKPCDLCLGVAAAREDLDQKQLPAAVEQKGEKLVLALHRPTSFVPENARDSWPIGPGCTALSWSETVPVPPPRV